MIKKLILPLMILGVSMSASGASDNYFTVSYNGATIANGETVVVSEAFPMNGMLMYDPIFNVNNVSGRDLTLFGGMMYMDSPSLAQMEADPSFWGTAQFCLSLCFTNGDSTWVGYGTEILTSSVRCTPEVHFCSPDAKETFRVILSAGQENAAGEYVEYDDSRFEMTVVYTQDPGKVELTEEDSGVPVYYDLTGREVSAPEKGQVVIKRQGAKTDKVIVR